MGSWERRRLSSMCHRGLIVAFTRQWRGPEHSALLQARDWYRDCHVLIQGREGDRIICEVVIMGRISYDGEVTMTVSPRMSDRGKRRHVISLPADMVINVHDPSD